MLVIGTAAACALPGLQRALLPRANGLTEIAPGVWADAPMSRDALLRQLAEGQARVTGFHGSVAPDRIILCTTQGCARRMRLNTAGLTYGHHLMLLGPDGLTAAVMGHELSHVALSKRYGTRGRQRIPQWLDEGLAVWLSPDPRYRRTETLAEARWITTAVRRRDWNRMTTQDTWRATYGAAGLA